ncbi:putative ankyrin [Cercophora samala]|uniref:Ankyrin n=1 Tax=Cercophora samala TaxID=330535 RepID=A0AA39Z1C5_9PEZI|nr:putative ankyrin [Cercophora samala]
MTLDIHFSGEPGDAAFDLVAVHGFLNTSSEAWDLGSASGPWLKTQLAAKKRYGRLLFHSYATTPSAVQGLCSRDAIQQEAMTLLQRIAEQRKDQDPSRPLLFVALDFGGLIVKEAIIQASRRTLEFANIGAATRLLAFVGSPHRWHHEQNLKSKLASFLFAKRSTDLTIDNINHLTDTVMAISEEFLQTRATIHSTLIGIYSTAPDAYGLHEISTSTFGIPMELRVATEKSLDAIQEASVQNTVVGALELRILGAIRAPTSTDALVWLNNAVVSLAPLPTPVKSVKSIGSDHIPFAWLKDTPAFQEWIDYHACKIMHIHGSPNLSDAAAYAFQEASLRASAGDFDGNLTLYFKFDRHDSQRNSIKAMSISFLAQILTRFGNHPASALFPTFEPPLFDKSLTEHDAFFVLNSFRLDCNRPARTTWVLDGLDECEPTSCNWFLTQLALIAGQCELYFKVLITTTSPKRVQAQLAGAGCESLSLDIRSSYVGPETALPVFEFNRHCLELEPYSSELGELLAAYWPDKDLFNMAVNWLGLQAPGWTTKAETTEAVTTLSPPSSRVLFAAVMEAVPTHSRSTACKILCWVKSSMRPLSPLELAAALAYQGADLGYLDIKPYLSRIFGPLLTIRHGEIHFSHTWVREHFSTADKAHWYAAASTADDHKEIAKVCLRFLRLPDTVKELPVRCGDAKASGVLLTSRHDMLSYAVTFWPAHYRLGYMAADTTDLAPEELVSFFGDSEASRVWFSAHGWLLPPHQRPDKSYFTALPIVAHLGFESQVEKILSLGPDLPNRFQPMEDALCEAARMGHKNVVDLLLNLPSTLTFDGVIKAMEAAAHAAEYETVEVLLAYAKNKHKDQVPSHSYPHSILARLAWAGKGKLLEALMQSRSAQEPISITAPASKLVCAVAGGHLGTIKTLLQLGEDVNYEDDTRPSRTALHMACRSGYGDAIRALVADSATDIEGRNSQGQTALQKAIVLGHIEVTKALLDGGADTASVEAEIPQPDGDGSYPYPAFFLVACESSFQCITALLERGVNADATTDEYTALCYAAGTGKLDWAKLLLAHGARVNGLGKWTPLCEAALKDTGKNLDMVKLLVDHGADVNASGSGDVATPLELAAEANLMEVVEFLIAKGADIGVHGAGSTALGRAAWKGHTKMVRYLLQSGFNPNQTHPTEGSWKALHWAHDCPACIEALLDGGADVDAMSQDGTALYIASFNNFPDAVQLLISRGANLELTCEFPGSWDSNCTALLGAAGKGNADIVRALLDAGADITARSPKNETALHLAISQANSEPTVRVLVEFTPDLDAQESSDGQTALHRLMWEVIADLNIAKALVRRGANLEIRNTEGYTVLDYAILMREYEIAKYLVKSKAKINVLGSNWGGPLHIACSEGNLDMVKFLVANGADVNMVDRVRGTPLHVVMSSYVNNATLQLRGDLARYLIDEVKADLTVRGGIHFTTVLNGACMQPDVDLLQHILDQDPVDSDINIEGFNGCRPLHFATFQSLEHVSKILARGADIDACDKLGRTILHTAVGSGRTDVVEKVLSLTGSRCINKTDRDGWTPLMWSVRKSTEWGMKSESSEEIVRLLLDQGASLWTTGRTCHQNGWSALKLARYYGASPEAMSLLTPKQRHYVDDRGEPQEWDSHAHRSRLAKEHRGSCDVCLYSLWGLGYANGQLWLCAKCYTYKDEFFPELKDWTPVKDGEEFDPDAPEDKEEEEEEEPAMEQVGALSPGQVKQVETTEANAWSDSDFD